MTEISIETPESATDGVEVIRRVVRNLPSTPGVYRMLNSRGDVLYVGKARNLKNRVTNYTHLAGLSNRICRMVVETAAMEIVTTHTEVEALLLESNLIKKLTPRYNVLLRDDKSFAYILVRTGHQTPQLLKHRGARNEKGTYFGPFASAGAVNWTITALLRAFQLRSCADTVFAARSRPCLQYQIKRCSAPCVGRVSPEDYDASVRQVLAFLQGRSREINQDLARQMEEAAATLDFERAAELRDRIRALAVIQARQTINVEGLNDADVIAAFEDRGQISIQVFFFRGGQNWGNRAYFPSHDRSIPTTEVLSAFIAQFYDNKPAPPLLLLSIEPSEADLLAEALTINAGHKVTLHVPMRGDKRELVDHALANAREALARRFAESSHQRKLLAGLAEVLGMPTVPNRIEVYDNSHIQGTNAIGAMIVAGPEGLEKREYRKFNIRGSKPPGGRSAGEQVACDREGALMTPGDDYAMMDEVLRRRFRRALDNEAEGAATVFPDLILIDGGAGQLSVARQVLADLGIDRVAVAAIAKGPDRNAGKERLFLPDKAPFGLESTDPVLYFLQRLRDEAHRFAIGTHRARRERAIDRSSLDDVAGIGPTRKRALLNHFGSARAVSNAGLDDLASVPGINDAVAKKIYDHFHGDG